MTFKRSKWRLAAAVLFGLSLTAVIPAGDRVLHAELDSSDPVITSVTWAPQTIDFNETDWTVHFTVAVTDEGTGVVPDGPHVFIESPSGAMFADFWLPLASGDVFDGTWEGEYTFNPLVHEEGVWVVRYVQVSDGAGHVATLDTAGLTARGIPTELTLGSGEMPYDVIAFAAPIDNDVANAARAGRTVPVKWHVSLDGQAVTDPSHFVSVTSSQVPPEGLPPSSDSIEVYSGQSGLQYLGEGWWQFNWKIPKTYAGQDRAMTLTLDDGSTYSASFSFR